MTERSILQTALAVLVPKDDHFEERLEEAREVELYSFELAQSFTGGW